MAPVSAATMTGTVPKFGGAFFPAAATENPVVRAFGFHSAEGPAYDFTPAGAVDHG
jgi:hypothetical protein